MTGAACQISQLAGAWWADMLGLGDIVDPGRRRRALEFIGAHNVAKVPGCPADEFCLDGSYMQSMTALAMGNYAAQAIAAGLPDRGWQAVEKIYVPRYEHDGCPLGRNAAMVRRGQPAAAPIGRYSFAVFLSQVF